MNVVKLNNLNINQLNQIDHENKINFKNLNISQLKEMIERQEKILSNKKFINSLPDKGEKVQKLKQILKQNLKNQELVLQNASHLSKLSLGEKIICEHPMAVKSEENSTNNLDLYSTARASAYNDNFAKRFTLNKTKKDLSDDVPTKAINLSVKQRYEDSALKFVNSCKPITVLSFKDSLELEKLNAEKQSRIIFEKKYQKLIEHYEKLNDDSENNSDDNSDDESNSESGSNFDQEMLSNLRFVEEVDN